MSTPSDEEALARLRALKAELDQAYGLSDRFGDERAGGRARELAAEIAGMPAHILNADQIETKLQTLTYVVEDYIVARAAQFLPDVADLWATVQGLPERDQSETPAEKPVAQLLVNLRAMGANDDDIRAAVNRASSLESYRNPRAPRWLSRTGIGNSRHDYPRLLGGHIRDFLKKNAGQSTGRSIYGSDDLVRLIDHWQRDAGAKPSDHLTRYYRQVILSAIAVLHKLGKSEAEINAIIVEAYEQKRPGKS